MVQKKYSEIEAGKFLNNTDWYKEQNFYKELGLALEWKLITKACLPDSYRKRHHFEGGDGYKHEDTQEYVIEQFAAKVGIPRAEFKRPDPFAMVYTVALHFVATEKLKEKVKGERLLVDKHHWSDVRASDGHFVYVGLAARDGMNVDRLLCAGMGGNLGVCLSR